MNPRTIPAVETVELSKQYESETGAPRLALDRVSLLVPAGQVVGILGKSGSGKTTLLRLLSGRTEASAGEARVFGQPASGGGVRAVLQDDPPPDLRLSLAEFLGPDTAASRGEDMDGLLRALSLHPWLGSPLQALPGILQNRAGLAAALLAGARLVLLDELPALDMDTARAIETWLPDRAHSRDQTLLLATRTPEIALSLCDRILVLRSGRMVFDTRVQHEIHNPAGCPAAYQILLQGRLDPARSAWFSGLEVASLGENTLISGEIRDESALYGVLARVRDLGLPLVELRRLDPCPAQQLRDWMG